MILKEFFEKNKRAAMAFSGGVDSSFLLYAAKKYGCDIAPYFVKTPFQPDFELRDARRVANFVGAELRLLHYDILADAKVAGNGVDRCYHCKKAIMDKIIAAARADGYDLLLDGTNASDESGDRPGMRALDEIGVLSPLRLCGLTKDEIRRLSRRAGLFTHSKPAYACLATRIPAGRAIDAVTLIKVERAEEYLFGLGFFDFRVRVAGEGARIEILESQMSRAVRRRKKIVEGLTPYFDAVLLDLRGR